MMGYVHCHAAAVLEAFPALQEEHIATFAALLSGATNSAGDAAAAADAALASPEQRAALAAVLNLGREDHALNAVSFERLAAVLSAALGKWRRTRTTRTRCSSCTWRTRSSWRPGTAARGHAGEGPAHRGAGALGRVGVLGGGDV